MSDPRVGRLLIASLHQAIAETLPTRLDFYEHWLSTAGLREGTIGLGSLSAVLSFLRAEGEAYTSITERAGAYAADWTITGLSGIERGLIRGLPGRLRMRAAFRVARALVRHTYPGSRAIAHFRGGSVSVDLQGSLFCDVRELTTTPLCGFYAAALARVFEQCGVPAAVQVHACRAAGSTRGCLMTIVAPPSIAETPAA